MHAERVSLAEAAARWWAREIGQPVTADQVIKIGPESCGVRVGGGICMRRPQHSGEHRANRHNAPHGRSWDIR